MNRFSNFFTDGLGSKLATKSYSNIPPRLKHIANYLVKCESQKNGINLKYVL